MKAPVAKKAAAKGSTVKKANAVKAAPKAAPKAAVKKAVKKAGKKAGK